MGIDRKQLQYVGEPGITLTCQAAVTRLLQHGDRVTHAVILTHRNVHGLLLSVAPGELFAVRSGFGSGYSGEGARRFSYVLELLDAHGTEISESAVTAPLLARLDTCALTERDLASIQATRRLGPWREYSWIQHAVSSDKGQLWELEKYPLVMPYGLVDSRLAGLALAFWDNPDDAIGKAFRRLEDIIRARIDCNDHGVRLLRKAFLETPARLVWADVDQAEQSSRGQLFVATFGSFRNPRAHREHIGSPASQLAEFFAVNHLFVLESSAVSPNARQG